MAIQVVVIEDFHHFLLGDAKGEQQTDAPIKKIHC
jgi:hypothetical protein